MSDNQLEQQLTDYLNEMKSVEEELNEQLDELAESIDESYGKISEMITSFTNMAVQSSNGLLSGKQRSAVAAVAAVGQIASSVVSAIGGATKAYKHNQYLSKLLKQKKEIATAKQASLQRMLPIIDKVTSRMERLLVNESVKEYDVASLADRQKCDMLIDNMDRFLDIYRTSQYLSFVSHYLDSEYSSWLSGNQTSGLPRPDYYVANKAVLELFDKNGSDTKKEYPSFFEEQPEKIKGSTIYCLMDSQLSATLLADLSSNTSELFYLPAPEQPAVNNIIDGNEALEHYTDTVEDFMRTKRRGPAKWNLLIWPTLLLGAVAVWLEWGRVSSWVIAVTVIAVILLCRYFIGLAEEALEEYALKIFMLPRKAHRDALDDAGYVEQEEEQDFEKKSVMKELFHGLMGG